MAEPLVESAGDAKIDLSAQHLVAVRGILRRHVPGLEIWAFGSRVTGRAKPYSDLDLAIMSQVPLPLAVYAGLSDDFAESDLPFKVDLVDWATTKEAFRSIIAQNRVVVQTQPTESG